MRRIALSFVAMAAGLSAALAGDAEIRAAQGSIEAQMRAFQSGDNALA